MDFTLLLIKLIVFLIGTLVLLPNVYCLSRKNFDVILFIYPIYYIFYVVPLALDILLPPPEFGKFVGLNKAYQLQDAHYIYSIVNLIFILCIWGMFLINRKVKQRKKKYLHTIKSKNLIILLMCLPVIYLLLNPSYFGCFLQGYAAKYSSSSVLVFPELLTQLGLFGTILYISSSKKSALKMLVGIFFAILCVYLNGKRYLAMWAVIYILYTAVISNKLSVKKAILTVFMLFPFIILFLLVYTLVIKKSSMDLYSVLRMSFGRDHAVIAAISRQLSNNPILEYSGQSILFYFVFFIPRKWLPAKPLPYNHYFAKMCFGYSLTSSKIITETVPPGIISECIANFGIFNGFLFSLIIIIFLTIIANHSKYIELKIIIIVLIGSLLMLSGGIFPSWFAAFFILIVSFTSSKIYLRNYKSHEY